MANSRWSVRSQLYRDAKLATSHTSAKEALLKARRRTTLIRFRANPENLAREHKSARAKYAKSPLYRAKMKQRTTKHLAKKKLVLGKEGYSAARNAYYRANSEREKWGQRARLYGMTRDQWLELFIQQGECCAICKKTTPDHKNGWATDHCHKTHEVRGILCAKCNNKLGFLGDTAEEAEATYLQLYSYLLVAKTGFFIPEKRRYLYAY